MVDSSSKEEFFQQTEDSTNQRRTAAESGSSRGHRVSLASTTSQSSYRSHKDALRHRILHLSELLRVERNNRDENTSCYLELVSKADREKAPSIRQAFERINQRSSANIAHLEQRLQDCCAQLKKLEQKVLVPQESSTSTASAQQQQQQQQQQHIFTHRTNFPRLPPFHLPRMRTTETGAAEEVNLPPLAESKESCVVSEPALNELFEEENSQRIQELKTQLLELREDHKALEDECHRLDEAWRADKKQMMEFLQEEKKRHYILEVQVNDVIQINLNEITNLKHDLACTEEKMVYQSYERSRDVWEVLETYQTRLAKLEMQQQAQQQEAMELPQASVYKLYGQLMNLLLTIAAILLVCASTVSACVLPLLRTRWRAITTLLVVIIITAAWHYFPHITQLEWKAWFPSAS
ncbi:testis-specific protein TEX28 [Sceloporus undulatus]|uniref:testis-specific protein TEX28 n=1 Tax=Sceloporus undulatus TaxID=8520 RepID=UPI001C4CB82D|nr:testis-specific protein TEX28 [Sceloporus undulatus]